MNSLLEVMLAVRIIGKSGGNGRPRDCQGFALEAVTVSQNKCRRKLSGPQLGFYLLEPVVQFITVIGYEKSLSLTCPEYWSE